jgi:MoaA/NifB/PqqE/SkfB family radical SAM enzyme
MAGTESVSSVIDRTCRFRRIKGDGFRLVMEITHRCNLRCKHCFVPKEKVEPSQQQIVQAVQEAVRARCRKVILTGGEPLLRSDLESIISACAQFEVLVDLNSNLTLLTQERARRLSEAGIGEVSASVHGDRATHDWLSGQAGCYDQAIKGIEMMLEAGIPVDVHSALWDGSLEQMISLVGLCEQLGIGSLTFFQIIPSEYAAHPPAAFTLNQHNALEKIAEVRAMASIPIRTIGLCAPDFSECDMGNGIVGINADFQMVTCLLAEGPSLPLRIGEFESLREQLKAQAAAGQWHPVCVPQSE